jgi:hypothetical protein
VVTSLQDKTNQTVHSNISETETRHEKVLPGVRYHITFTFSLIVVKLNWFETDLLML